MAVRFFILNAGFAVLFALLGFNLYKLQIDQSADYIERAQARDASLEERSLDRGRIFVTNRNGTEIPVAQDRSAPAAYANPQLIQDAKEAASFVGMLLGISVPALEEKFSDKDNQFMLLADHLSPEHIEALREAPKGIYVDGNEFRYYPSGHFASHLLGFVGVNAETPKPTGLYGSEKYFNEILAAEGDVHLSLDRDVQAEAESALARLMADYGGTGGTVIVMDPKTGKLLALASAPDFDPNDYRSSPVANFINPAFSYHYEPGSVMKAVTMASAIDAGVVTPTTVYTDYGYVTRNGRTIHNFEPRPYGKITMTNVIERSVNTGSVFAAEQLGRDAFLGYQKKFGFGAPTGVEAPEEVAGSLKNLTKSDTKAIDLATASFGQGTAVTPLQMVTAYAALANGGVRMVPSFLKNTPPREAERAVSETSARKVLAMMESAVNVNKVAVIPGYRVAGKTGTALIPDFEKGGYSDELIHTFVGIAPVSDPHFVVLMKLDRPKVGELAGLTVVPATRDLLEFLLTHYRVPPDNVGT